MRKQVQKQVLEHLKANGSITSLEAFERYRATRLASVIHRLRDTYNITTIMMESNDGGAQYAKYVFLGTKEGE